MRLHDAHNHLQDDRFGGHQTELVSAARSAGVATMVVNGAAESDWPAVLDLARRHPMVRPSFGFHPWYVAERSRDWRHRLVEFLDTVPSGVGEIGLDRWKPGLSYDGQEEVFRAQLQIAAERNLPASIHCLQAWGRMLEFLQAGPVPQVGFLLHSYGGPVEMVPALARCGAYFGFPGAFLAARKARHQATFRSIPRDRLLIETDAPDQPLPPPEGAAVEARPVLESGPVHHLPPDAAGRVVNHPANLPLVHRGLAGILGIDPVELAGQLEGNFLRLFGTLRRQPTASAGGGTAT